MNSPAHLRIGIVGTGMISNVIAGAIKNAENAVIGAISSRSMENAEAFAATHQVKKAFDDWKAMLSWDGIDAVYLGIPTVAKEAIAIAAAQAGKHVLADKPFSDLASLQRMTDAARANKVAFMDATHFVHHPRTSIIQQNTAEQIGTPQAVNTSFFFPHMNKEDIRYNLELEPTGAIGDMAWYSVRAIVEYLPTAKKIKDIQSFAQRDPETNAFLRAAGIIIFADGSTSNWDIGYNAGVCILDLNILGTDGLISLDDFVLDWAKGFVFDDKDHKVGYTLRKGMATPKEFVYIETPSEKDQATLLIENFAQLAQESHPEALEKSIQKSEATQQILDAIWASIMN